MTKRRETFEELLKRQPDLAAKIKKCPPDGRFVAVPSLDASPQRQHYKVEGRILARSSHT